MLNNMATVPKFSLHVSALSSAFQQVGAVKWAWQLSVTSIMRQVLGSKCTQSIQKMPRST